MLADLLYYAEIIQWLVMEYIYCFFLPVQNRRKRMSIENRFREWALEKNKSFLIEYWPWTTSHTVNLLKKMLHLKLGAALKLGFLNRKSAKHFKFCDINILLLCCGSGSGWFWTFLIRSYPDIRDWIRILVFRKGSIVYYLFG
jgi:hypothetical protein